jgi:hypothetical protein
MPGQLLDTAEMIKPDYHGWKRSAVEKTKVLVLGSDFIIETGRYQISWTVLEEHNQDKALCKFSLYLICFKDWKRNVPLINEAIKHSKLKLRLLLTKNFNWSWITNLVCPVRQRSLNIKRPQKV